MIWSHGIIHFSLATTGTIWNHETIFLYKLIAQKVYHILMWMMNVLKSCINVTLWANTPSGLLACLLYNMVLSREFSYTAFLPYN